MTNSAADEASDYNSEIINEFRANGGRVGGMWEGTTLILIHHIGARSGIERVTPVACSPRGKGRFSVWAANGGSPTHPNWYHNLKAHPRSPSRPVPDVHGPDAGTERYRPRSAVAKLVAEWPKPAPGSPDLGAAQARTTRQFPVFMLTRQD